MPITPSSHEADRATSAPPSPPSARRQRPRLSFDPRSLGAGCIVWLPPKGDDDIHKIRCMRETCCLYGELQKEGYDHPVVVLKLDKNYNGEIVCSFGVVTTKEHKYRCDRIKISQEGLAPPAYGDGDCTTELYLEKGTMNQQSYVKVQHIFRVPASQLRLCSFRCESRAYDSRLDEKSYRFLMTRFNMEPETWIHTSVLKSSLASPQEPLTPQYMEQYRPSRPAPVANPNISSPSRFTEVSPLLPNYTSSRLPGEWDSYARYPTRVRQPLNRDYDCEAYGGYRRVQQGECVASPVDDDGDAKFSAKSLLIILAIGAVVWWNWKGHD